MQLLRGSLTALRRLAHGVFVRLRRANPVVALAVGLLFLLAPFAFLHGLSAFFVVLFLQLAESYPLLAVRGTINGHV